MVFFLTLGSIGLELSIMESSNIIVTACNTTERVSQDIDRNKIDRNKMYFVTEFYSLV